MVTHDHRHLWMWAAAVSKSLTNSHPRVSHLRPLMLWGAPRMIWKLSSSNQWKHAAMRSCMRTRDEAQRIGIWAELFGLNRSPAHSLVNHDHQYTLHTCWCGSSVNDSYQQGALLDLFLLVWATGCNQCKYSPFTGSPHQQVWGVYKSKLLKNALDNQDH
jgi:hypothetical protein